VAPASSFQSELLAPVLRDIDDVVGSSRGRFSRLDILESVASVLSSFSVKWYAEASPWRSRAQLVPVSTAERIGSSVQSLPLDSHLALAGLATPEIDAPLRKQTGAFYTDFRLAEYLVSAVEYEDVSPPVIDLASGTGTLLVAAALRLGGGDRKRLNRIVGKELFGVDRDHAALRGAALALAGLALDKPAISRLWGHLIQRDSLTAPDTFWRILAPDGFGLVVGNPPWERLKVTRHEHLRRQGVSRLYGEDYGPIEDRQLQRNRERLRTDITRLYMRFGLQDVGETDLYKLFLELALKVARSDGIVLQLLPAGLIRSLGARALRQELIQRGRNIRLTVFDNRPRFFAIDSRFKFVALQCRVGPMGHRQQGRIELVAGSESLKSKSEPRPVTIRSSSLLKLRPDLTIPEVRSEDEWACFRLATQRGTTFDAGGGWGVSFHRELDMTNDREIFRRDVADFPVVEGRMVHQYRHAWKVYITGQGRAARWKTIPRKGSCHFLPQFWCGESDLGRSLQQRVSSLRFGFCDITGQTNERTMLASAIPAGVVCGNKVPTLSFDGRSSENAETRGYLWLGIVNSFAYDWLVRRVTTTTLNFFVLRSVPLPAIDADSKEAQGLVSLARTLSRCDHVSQDDRLLSEWEYAEFRAEVEWRVLGAYDLDLAQLSLILEDFPLLDRAQAPLKGEARSTVTRDLVLLRAAEQLGGLRPHQLSRLRVRVEAGKELGAVPFLPPNTDPGLSEMAVGIRA
jgi:hypothetical protein